MERFCKCFLFSFGILLASACQEGREAGDLLGQWRLRSSSQLYISFSGSVTHLLKVGGTGVFGNFQHKGDSLFIQCYSAEGVPADTAIVEGDFGFRPFNDIRLKIETLDGDDLVLSKDSQKWSFYLY